MSPGLSSILIKKIGLSNFTPHFNLQGMACSSFLKVLELGEKLVQNDTDNVLIVISGCNSGWYLPHLKNNMIVKNPNEITIQNGGSVEKCIQEANENPFENRGW